MKAIIPAAGMGTRFLPVTKAQPKEMLSIINKPAIQYIVEEALDSKADEVIIVSSPDKTSIMQQFTPFPKLEKHLRELNKNDLADSVVHAGNLEVSCVYQYEPLGLGHAVWCAAEKTADQPFLVMLGDVIVPDNAICPKLMEISEAHGGASVISVIEVPDEQVSRFGIVGGVDIEDNVIKVDKMIEKPSLEEAPSNYAIFGRYLLTPRVMELITKTSPGNRGEIQLTDALVKLMDEEEIYAYIIKPDDGYDTGTIETWLETNIILAMREPKIAEYLKNTVGHLFV